MTADPSLDVAPFGFAILRTPLLAFDELAAWGADLEASRLADACASDWRRWSSVRRSARPCSSPRRR
jgi:hypothetical protein